MTPSEDLKRLAVAVRWVGRGSGVIFFLLFLVTAFASGESAKMMALSLTGLVLAPVVLGETAVLAWIIEGVVTHRDEGGGMRTFRNRDE